MNHRNNELLFSLYKKKNLNSSSEHKGKKRYKTKQNELEKYREKG
jgi:hypothetical protein